MSYDLNNISNWILTFIGAGTGILGLYLAYKQWKRNEPKLNYYLENSRYSICIGKKQSGETIYELTINGTVVVNNEGGTSTSITGCIGLLRYSKSVSEYLPEVIQAQAPPNLFPVNIPSDGSIKFNLILSFKFDNNPTYLDRCGVAINLDEPKKWKWDDCPIRGKLIFKHTKGEFEMDICVFRSDIPESKRSISFDYSHIWNIAQNFKHKNNEKE